MKQKIKLAAMGFLMTAVAAALTACGEDPELAQFRKDVDAFCTDISEIDTAINSLTAVNNLDASEADAATDEALNSLERLDTRFQEFAELDFPEEFDYLEPLADEASEYMSTAVSSYRDAFTNDSYDEAAIAAQCEYARQNSARAYRRIQIIITFLHGEEPEEMGLSTQPDEPQ